MKLQVGTSLIADDAERYRKRAQECRTLAAGARDDRDRHALLEVAEDLEIEAAEIEAQAAKHIASSSQPWNASLPDES
ncbi:hypothetical protein ACUXST_002564 [Sphingomonas sp. F9_3S_D5_B_2]